MLRRLIRNTPDALERLLSAVRLWFFSLGYPTFRCGSDVVLCRGAVLKMVPGAKLVIGDRVRIDRFASILCEGEIIIGSDSYIGQGTIIAANERIVIGHDALVAANVTIRDQDHGMKPGTPYRLQEPVNKPVEIGHNVWIGAGAAVLKGVTIGENCVVGAGAVVTSSLSPAVLAAGSPARILRQI